MKPHDPTLRLVFLGAVFILIICGYGVRIARDLRSSLYTPLCKQSLRNVLFTTLCVFLVLLFVRIPQTLRISGCLSVILVVFLLTAILVKVDVTPLPFFMLTMIKIVCINCECPEVLYSATPYAVQMALARPTVPPL